GEERPADQHGGDRASGFGGGGAAHRLQVERDVGRGGQDRGAEEGGDDGSGGDGRARKERGGQDGLLGAPLHPDEEPGDRRHDEVGPDAPRRTLGGEEKQKKPGTQQGRSEERRVGKERN